MTTVAVLADPPAETDALAGVVEAGPLDAEAATRLYTATLRDACAAVERSGGDLLVNHRPLDAPEEEAEEAVASAVAPALDDPDGARYEVQVGSTRSSRVGNTVTHLLEREAVRSAAVLDPAVALAERRHVDSAAMKLRGAEVVLGPTASGGVWYAGFTEPVDFTDALAAPSLRGGLPRTAPARERPRRTRIGRRLGPVPDHRRPAGPGIHAAGRRRVGAGRDPER